MTDSLLTVDVQVALSDDSEEPPAPDALSHWANIAYQAVSKSPCEVTIRLVDEPEMVQLNESFRGKQGTTNVLSFPFESELDLNFSEELLSDEGAPSIDEILGDIVICHAVIQREAQEQGKSEVDHYAHMITHGVLHLCGYDHMNDAEAQEMEALEVKVLAQSHIQNPYN